jgi:hypothetical protein
MSDLNIVILTGRLVRDPDLRREDSGNLWGLFTLASNYSYKDKSGAKQEDAAFVDCKTFGRWAESLAQRKKETWPSWPGGSKPTRGRKTAGSSIGSLWSAIPCGSSGRKMVRHLPQAPPKANRQSRRRSITRTANHRSETAKTLLSTAERSMKRSVATATPK